MHIIHITCAFPPYEAGIGNVAYNQSKELVKLGHRVQVFTPRYKKKYKKKENLHGIEVVRLTPLLKWGNAAFIPGLFFKLKNADIIHLHYPFFGGAEIAAKYIIFKRIQNFFCKPFKPLKMPKLITTYHMDVASNGLAGILNIIYKKIYLPFILSLSDKILASSIDYIQSSDIKKYFFKNAGKFLESPFGAGANDDCGRRLKELRIRYNIKNGKKNILFLGALDSAHYFKGLEYLLRAFAGNITKFSDSFRLIVAGDGDLKKHYEQIVKGLNIEKDVIFAGSADNKTKWALYEMCDLLVLPSINRGEAFGIVLIEAMSRGLPVIASNLPGVRTVVDNGINGFLTIPKDADELTDKIRLILLDDNLARIMGERGRRKAETKYNWAKIGKELEKIYKS